MQSVHRCQMGVLVIGLPRDGLTRAQLVLTPFHSTRAGKPPSRLPLTVQAQRLASPFVEGSGRGGKGRTARGTGTGVTWSCASDSNIRNRRADCADAWQGGLIGVSPTAMPQSVEVMSFSEPVVLEVTSDVQIALAEGATTICDLQIGWGDVLVHWPVLTLNRPRGLRCPSSSPQFRCGTPPRPERARKEMEASCSRFVGCDSHGKGRMMRPVIRQPHCFQEFYVQ